MLTISNSRADTISDASSGTPKTHRASRLDRIRPIPLTCLLRPPTLLHNKE